MSEPQQPPVPPTHQPPQAPPAPPAASPLQANPQYPAAGQHPFPAQYPAAATQQQHQHPQQQAAPQYPTPQYPTPQYPMAPQPAGGQAARGNGLGRVAFIVALLTLAVGLLISLLRPFMYYAADFSATGVGLLDGLGSVLTLAGAVAALILGLIAIRRPAPHLLAGIAIGIAASHIASILVGWISSLFYRFF